jgi:thiamine-monophosphate kinase
MMKKDKVAKRQMGELDVMRYLRKRFPKRRRDIVKGIGDDAMVLRDGYVISTDSFFEQTHFDLDYYSYYDVGYHSMAASLSDLAAMAATPITALIALSVSRKIKARAIRELYDGLDELAKKFKCDISGGDIVASQTFGMTITVIGRAERPLLRSGARPGDNLYVSNFLGLAEAGRIVLQRKLPVSQYPDAVRKHLYPEPRITEAQAIRKFVSACIDTSDGLSTDAFHLTEESRVKIVIDADHIPIHSEVGKLCSLKGYDPTRFILASGEDFELLFTAQRLPKIARVKIFRIGRVTRGRGLYIASGRREYPLKPQGYEHIPRKS